MKFLFGAWINISSLVFVLLSGSVGPAIGQDSELVIQPFYEKIGRPVLISYFQAPQGLADQLRILDTSGLIVEEDDWYSFFSADFWVFFIKSPEHVERLPVLVQKIFQSVPPPEPGSLSQRVDVKLHRVRHVMAKFIFMNEFEGKPLAEVKCKSASMIFSGISGGITESDSLQSFLDCTIQGMKN